jgi:DMSO/TMAO reductase YedYZ molybdopterin-dependent catalytic subunit
MLAGLRSLSARVVARTSRDATRAQPFEPGGLVAADPGEPTMSRRGALTLVGSGVLLIVALTVGQTIGGSARGAALLLPRGRGRGDFPVNKTAVAAGISPESVGPGWVLTLRGGPSEVTLDRDALAGMPHRSARLPIACVEGWSTVQTWTGVRLAELARVAGVPSPRSARVVSLQRGGAFGVAILQANQIGDPDALLALQVNGADLSLDHGYPARIIVPALPGVHNTKWVASIEFESS